MKKILFTMSLITVAIGASVGTAQAATITGNQGNVVLIGSCAEMGTAANNNKGNVIILANHGRCNVTDIVNNPVITNNTGNVVRIGNACGNTGGTISNNKGNVVVIDRSGPCLPNRPTTVVVTPKAPVQTTVRTPQVTKKEVTKAAATVVTPPATATPAAPSPAAPTQLPVTGTESVIGMFLGTSALAYAGAVARSKRIADKLS